MKQIGSLFDVYRKKLRPPQASVEKQASAIISEITRLPIRPEQLAYSPVSRTIRIKAPSVLRSEVLKWKTEVLQALADSLGERNCPKELV